MVSAPIKVKTSYLNKAIASKKEWILKQIIKKRPLQETIKLNYQTGDQLHIKGLVYTLAVDTQLYKRSKIDFLNSSQIILYVKPKTDRVYREKVVLKWYRKLLKSSIAQLIEIWEPLLGVRINQFGVRKMKTRWGSCNINAKRIWLNLALIKYKEKYLEYVVVHEMIHLIERGHNQRFKSLMDRFVPNWRQLKKELNLVDL